MAGDEERDGVSFSNLDQPLFDGAGATKRDLVDYLDAVHHCIIPALHSRPLSVSGVHSGEDPFMQKNVPKYTPEWVAGPPSSGTGSPPSPTSNWTVAKRTV